MEAIAQQFTDFYYQTFDADRSALQSLYRPNSMLSFEGQQMQGAEAIVEKLKSLPFQKVQHKVETRDAQPTGDGNSLTVMVTGALVVDDSPQPMRFSQTFVLIPDAGSYFVFNDIFREDPFNIQTSDWSTTIFSHSIENPLRKLGEDTDGCRKLPCIGTFAYVFCARNGCSGGCLEGYCAAAEGSSF